MPKTILLFLAILVFCVGCSDNRFAKFESNLRGEKFSENNRAEVNKQMRIVEAELKAKALKDHPWAGVYTQGLPLGAMWKIAIAPKAGFAYTCISSDVFEGNRPALYDQNYGEAVWENGRIKLSPVLENDRQDHFPFSTEYVLIPWGDQLCLVPADGIIDFCNTVNAGFGIYFVRGDYDIFSPPRPKGMPDVPEEFKPYLLEKPVEGEIIAVGETREYRDGSSMAKESIVTVNRGSRDGILPGMNFIVTNPEKVFAPIKLTEVSEMESVGIIKQGTKQETPQVGWSVSTRHPWARPSP
jgi:hypothetical protein